ncbi:hypothetical protein [Streptococcus pluranimalium]|uniref:Uncharacterized protein n=1 Tax=Streptococcus pluranimalium TaxID=82348 RepID=A0A345VJL6_9STRE|nr:hypothetical protein [Streptococcus pluranimalium]AXJ12918.1 hypothetical protein Sp14A_09970 [Streptococcus pluranimalium]
MENIKSVVNIAFENIRKWNVIHIFFIFPFSIAFFLIAAYIVPNISLALTKEILFLENHLLKIDYLFFVPDIFLGLLFFIFWFLYTYMIIISKSRKLFAYFLNQCFFLTLCLLMYHAFFYASNILVGSTFLRIVYWVLYLLSFIYLFFGFYKSSKNITILSFNSNKISYIAILAWVVLGTINIFTNNMLSNSYLKFLNSLLVLIPLFCIVIFNYFFFVMIDTIKIIYQILKNQEYYRKELGYSIEEWYGKKSKMYRDSVKQNDLE